MHLADDHHCPHDDGPADDDSSPRLYSTPAAVAAARTHTRGRDDGARQALRGTALAHFQLLSRRKLDRLRWLPI